MYSMHIFPTEAFENDYKTTTPAIFAGVVAGTFLMVMLVFVMYDLMVLKRNEAMIANAAKSNAIVTSLVPDHLRDRLLQQQKQKGFNARGSGNLKTFLNDGSKTGGLDASSSGKLPPPLADLYLETTVLFADIW